MNIYVPAVSEFDSSNEALVNTIVHEFVHCMIELLADHTNHDDHYQKLVELTTTTITDNLLKMLETDPTTLRYPAPKKRTAKKK